MSQARTTGVCRTFGSGAMHSPTALLSRSGPGAKASSSGTAPRRAPSSNSTFTSAMSIWPRDSTDDTFSEGKKAPTLAQSGKRSPSSGVRSAFPGKSGGSSSSSFTRRCSRLLLHRAQTRLQTAPNAHARSSTPARPTAVHGKPSSNHAANPSRNGGEDGATVTPGAAVVEVSMPTPASSGAEVLVVEVVVVLVKKVVSMRSTSSELFASEPLVSLSSPKSLLTTPIGGVHDSFESFVSFVSFDSFDSFSSIASTSTAAAAAAQHNIDIDNAAAHGATTPRATRTRR
mmetsp:Transcript_4588/g.13018  ORF Transcript_4588/g.13018 Transcript_4588/m.13018 type:complete len:287 (-) Transcript_4588:219-1079(-)